MDYRRFRLPDFKAIPRRDYWLAAFAGLLLALSFPKPGFSILAWCALVPLMLACGNKSPQKAFKLGFVTGLVAYAGILYWINIVVTTYGKLPWIVSLSVFMLLVAYLALYLGALAWLVRLGEKAGIAPLVSFPVLWVGLEYLRSFLLTGFPWASLGHSQYRTLPLIQIVDITGVYGLSFLIALANIVLYLIIRAVVKKEPEAYPTRGLIVLLLLLVLVLFYGSSRLSSSDEGKPLKVALVQGNIEQDIKWDPAFQETTVAAYERLSREACATGVDLLVWPESAAPFFFQSDAKFTPRIRALARAVNSPMVVGSPAYERECDTVRYYNSAFLLSPSGEILGRSDKIHLVPFGEYVPLAQLFPFVHKMVAGIGDFSAGAKPLPLNTGKGQIGVLICFEGIFPDLAREYVREGSRLLVNITNDAWFGRSSAPYQHLSMIVFRAVENRVPVVRAANTGITSIIDSKGHIRAMTPLFKETFLTGEVRLGEGGTFYGRFGDIFAWLCLAGGAVICIRIYRRKSRKT